MRTTGLITFILSLIFISTGCGIHNGNTNQNDTTSLPDESRTTGKMQHAGLADGRWRLVSLLGKDIEENDQEQAAYLVFSQEDQRVSGFNSCNNISGSYSIEKGQQLRFSQMITTMRACMNSVEQDFMKVLERADNFAIKGDTLSLNRARMAPLARFVREPME